MEIVARLKYFRTSPRKVRLVTDLIRGLNIPRARAQLQYLGKRVAGPILKLLNSAVTNAKHNLNLSEQDLYIKNILVDGGPSLKRWMPRAMGRATPIMKRTSHITIVLEPKPGLKKEPVKAETKKEKEITPEPETKTGIPELTEQSLGAVKKTSKPSRVSSRRPYPASPQAKKRFFSRQTFGNIKKMFRRKSI